MEPFVSVIIPVFNRKELLLRAVESVLNQTYGSYELIVIDDGSTIDLLEVQERVMGAGHKFVRTPHRGVAAARNTGVKLAVGEWICLLDSDDLWYPTKLEVQLAYHDKYPVKLSQTMERWYRNEQLVNKARKHLQPEGDIFEQACQLCCISSSSVILHRSVYESCGLYDEDFTVCEDYEFWLRVCSKYSVGLVEHELVEKYGGHADQLSKAVPAMDRFRVLALTKLLMSSSLTKVQKQQAVQVLKNKLDILAIGAKKRHLTTQLFYQSFLSDLEIEDCMSNLRPFYSQLLKICAV